MIPEFGHFALILALCLALLQFCVPFLKIDLAARALALGQAFFVSISFLCLAYAFVQDDFSVQYVAAHSNAALPLIYKISAIWGGHEGAILLWIGLLMGWMVAFACNSQHLPVYFSVRVLAVLGLTSAGFLLFLLVTSNPFARLLPHYPIDGGDLNPLLQDPGLVIHPPLLYMGYVGFSIPFALAVGTLCSKETLPFAKWMRPWVLSAWAFLTLGVVFGSWWAYYELGWGGWWGWDPVENASFIPWLVGVALIHSAMATDKKNIFQNWTLLLAIVVFALSLLGTFLVRSGILTSIHAFANDPKRGIFLLYFLSLVVGGALILYAAYGRSAFKKTELDFFSRETIILFSMCLLLVAAATVLLGTLFPLMYETFNHQKISVGYPYFNLIFIPLMIPVLFFIPIGPWVHWGHNRIKTILKPIYRIGALSVALGIVFSITHWTIYNVLGLTTGLWIIFGTLKSFLKKVKKRGGVTHLTFGAWGMILAHIGMGVLVIGVTIVSNAQIEREVRLKPLQQLAIADYQVQFQTIRTIEGPNYLSHQGHFEIYQNNKKIADLFPEKRIFVVQGSVMTETAILPGLLRDLYISLGTKLDDGGWSMRIYYKPFVRWIWLGALMMAVGGFLAAVGRRHHG